jgi:cytochrome c-type biogenesis protein CcmH/NrfG
VEDFMSDAAQAPKPEASLGTIVDHLLDLTSEQALLRESIVTAAEWDYQSRQVRQGLLDETLRSVRRWNQILVGMLTLLVVVLVSLIVLVAVLLTRLQVSF